MDMSCFDVQRASVWKTLSSAVRGFVRCCTCWIYLSVALFVDLLTRARLSIICVWFRVRWRSRSCTLFALLVAPMLHDELVRDVFGFGI